MAFDCNNCLSACRADCCHGPVPFEKTFVAAHKFIREPVLTQDLGDNAVILLARDEREPDPKKFAAVCPFLGFDDKCSVYEDRPFVCRKFGDGSSTFMTCSYQAPDGRVRSRQERRHVERVGQKAQERTIESMRTGVPSEDDRALVSDPQWMAEHAKLWPTQGAKR